MFVLVYLNRGNDVKVFKSRRYYLPKGIIKNFNFIANGKGFYDQPIYSDLKQCKEVRTLKTRQREDCTTGYLLDQNYIKNHYRLIAVDLGRQR